MQTYERGNRSEGIILSAYINAGLIVSVPFGTGASYDLVVDTGARLLKIQVKTAWLDGGCLRYHSQRRRGGGYETRRLYRDGEADYFAVYCPQTDDLYAVPAEKHRTEGRLRLTPAKNKQQKLIKYAADYSWEKHIREIKGKATLVGIEPTTSTSGALRSIH